jgi:hypothetical protein
VFDWRGYVTAHSQVFVADARLRRQGVTETLHAPSDKGLIAMGGGQITVKDRKAMERTAGETYGVPEAEYRRLIG